MLPTSAVVLAPFAIPYFHLVDTGSFLQAAIGEIIGFGFVFGFGYGAIPGFYTENFPTRCRASGASAGYQISQGLWRRPDAHRCRTHSQGLWDSSSPSLCWLYVGLLVMLYAACAILAILATPETGKGNLVRLGATARG